MKFSSQSQCAVSHDLMTAELVEENKAAMFIEKIFLGEFHSVLTKSFPIV